MVPQAERRGARLLAAFGAGFTDTALGLRRPGFARKQAAGLIMRGLVWRNCS